MSCRQDRFGVRFMEVRGKHSARSPPRLRRRRTLLAKEPCRARTLQTRMPNRMLRRCTSQQSMAGTCGDAAKTNGLQRRGHCADMPPTVQRSLEHARICGVHLWDAVHGTTAHPDAQPPAMEQQHGGKRWQRRNATTVTISCKGRKIALATTIAWQRQRGGSFPTRLLERP